MSDNFVDFETKYCFKMVKIVPKVDDIPVDQWFGKPLVKRQLNIMTQEPGAYGFVINIVDNKKEAFVTENASQAFFVFLSLAQAAEMHGYKLILEPF